MKAQLKEAFQVIEPELWETANYLYAHPELGDQEFESSKRLINILKKHGFQMETGIADRPTAFKATFSSEKPGPTIGYLAEYDALPGIGHGCGHNLIGTMSAGAGVLLSKFLQDIGGSVVVLGTPAEETNGAKVPMSEQGIFDDIDVAMILHPNGNSYQSGKSLAMDAIQFAYTGKSAHAAAAPEKGINALDSVIQLFNGINALRQHIPSSVRIHGVISEGGKAANVVPDYAEAQFYVRAEERKVLDEVVKKVVAIAEGAGQMTGAKLAISNYELSYDNMITNRTLSDAFTANLQQVSELPILPAREATGSIDMGNVSHVVPAIHPYIGLNDSGLVAHTKEFADKTISKEGHEALISGALALAGTGFDVLTNKDLLEKIKAEFAKKVSVVTA
ncbi:M20 family metallopeptidase [Virgibacillus sp. 179-BFC.A HS]|uniref:Peptidase M20 domain-containing protein 2 n=1 Tax=Tigheibacillus jepli TaxID=3035914 RepID=A0ABU5CMA0_9BACI|nr:M20 family metallopeptidase [Virgibacillus sp. 179-BFC.A HS]MDY0406947.1 M20 family metallopeptidase [Virgibacillus sp. 179-BFC.A HS]